MADGTAGRISKACEVVARPRRLATNGYRSLDQLARGLVRPNVFRSLRKGTYNGGGKVVPGGLFDESGRIGWQHR